ncbi:PadR family transcriptional regulator [Amphiplicatus metriothermophilus]|uniref:DNA-binding transcriptional regulator, PadR family n=1 Tax=Amphiplicatus metriothermophilus TaxID=1519374 RepID=A0A239PIR6_9PROT|nr:PadR family transcriptional regulator [Amphiplicatus metriothermophilus]MBB5518151.1 DNA-binding PadR family transcriptional regulator [Amphiplicatus metriothermophilus]SNT67515.1 DNA-binding transcriptional regulator, PadR family [Amphiplicatus metriothermophilus]
MKYQARASSRRPSSLGYAILGLLAARPWTGYEIGRLFAETPIAIYSSSPGSIYPAIKGLRAAGLVERAPHPDNPDSSKRVFAITPRGRAALRDWLAAPVAREDVRRNMQDLMLRFAFMSGNLPEAAIIRFLKDLKRETEAHIEALEAHAEQMRAAAPLSGVLALQAGIDGYRKTARWAQRALDAFVAGARAPQKTPPEKTS